MRIIVVLVVAWSVAASAFAEEHEVQLDIAQKDIDIENRTIHFSMGTVAKSAEFKVFTPTGKLLHSGREEYDHPAPGTRLEVSWPDLHENQENFFIDLRFTDEDGSWAEYHVVRFYFEIPHEDIEFESGKAIITPEERAKLDEPIVLLEDAVARYAHMMDIGLYVIGHTDTVGPTTDNQRLSEKRASAIAKVFLGRDLKALPIYVRGCGEGVPAVKTADNVPEARNRRAQYIVSSFMPDIPGPGKFHRVQ
ncbi:MAG TPA: OmpA family protein [Polyangiales bacterium]|nr:OmpA family protein [Polyangiales bacterium]